MSRAFKLRPQARFDLRSISDYSDAQWGAAQARSYLIAIADAFDRIAMTPLAGSDQTSVSPGLRKWRSGSHNIYYRIIDRTVVIVRILHVRADLARVSTTLQGPTSASRAQA